jgi:hypothetical protein
LVLKNIATIEKLVTSHITILLLLKQQQKSDHGRRLKADGNKVILKAPVHTTLDNQQSTGLLPLLCFAVVAVLICC